MRIGNCFVQLEGLHYSRSTPGEILGRSFANPVQSHIRIAQSRISHCILWIQSYGLLKILDTFFNVRSRQLVHEEVRLEESLVGLLIVCITPLQALGLFVV